MGCKELRARGLLLKLLEAIFKTGNRMNAGTSRGNAQAFNLNALRKFSNVKSTDGKTTLLHFVVEEVVRAEGKRCVRAEAAMEVHQFLKVPNLTEKKNIIMLGLQTVGGLSSKFSKCEKESRNRLRSHWKNYQRFGNSNSRS
ncbi:hypothetical protein M9H77_08859 [Catharanthus roseus]|uniref:Uncharacterized protein n=1 Tax=Catharanthus roseus TaxID=4058 RepID=A0ACC0BZB3_CATRO|nr:hypothetical protein M9H77_08859 [Catharanthus roseus]